VSRWTARAEQRTMVRGLCDGGDLKNGKKSDLVLRSGMFQGFRNTQLNKSYKSFAFYCLFLLIRQTLYSQTLCTMPRGQSSGHRALAHLLATQFHRDTKASKRANSCHSKESIEPSQIIIEHTKPR